MLGTPIRYRLSDLPYCVVPPRRLGGCKSFGLYVTLFLVLLLLNLDSFAGYFHVVSASSFLLLDVLIPISRVTVQCCQCSKIGLCAFPRAITLRHATSHTLELPFSLSAHCGPQTDVFPPVLPVCIVDGLGDSRLCIKHVAVEVKPAVLAPWPLPSTCPGEAETSL